MVKIPAEVVSRKMESCGDAVAEVLAVVVVGSVGCHVGCGIGGNVGGMCGIMGGICVVASVGWEMCGLW